LEINFYNTKVDSSSLRVAIFFYLEPKYSFENILAPNTKILQH
jgi:hypothetical protein